MAQAPSSGQGRSGEERAPSVLGVVRRCRRRPFLRAASLFGALALAVVPRSQPSMAPAEGRTTPRFDAEAETAPNSWDAEPGTEPAAANAYDISLRMEYVRYLETQLAPLPKKVHVFFPDAEYYKAHARVEFVQKSIVNLLDRNPRWNVTVYDDAMVDGVIRRAADLRLIPAEERDALVGVADEQGRVHAGHIVERSDLARLLLMYMEGGLYIDADRLLSKRIEDVLAPGTRLCLPTHGDVNFAQDLMCSARGNKLFEAMIQEATKMRRTEERRQGWIRGGSLFDLGPVLYNDIIDAVVFAGEEEVFRRHGSSPDFFAGKRTLLAGSRGTIVTAAEEGCNVGLLVDEDTMPRCASREALYDAYNMTPWAIEVNDRWGD